MYPSGIIPIRRGCFWQLLIHECEQQMLRLKCSISTAKPGSVTDEMHLYDVLIFSERISRSTYSWPWCTFNLWFTILEDTICLTRKDAHGIIIVSAVALPLPACLLSSCEMIRFRYQILPDDYTFLCSFYSSAAVICLVWLWSFTSISIFCLGSPFAHCGRWGHHHRSVPAGSSILSKAANR